MDGKEYGMERWRMVHWLAERIEVAMMDVVRIGKGRTSN